MSLVGLRITDHDFFTKGQKWDGSISMREFCEQHAGELKVENDLIIFALVAGQALNSILMTGTSSQYSSTDLSLT